MNRKYPTKKRGQAMVEFAASLVLLLTLLYGLLETGRLLFIYASTVTAARQAARYGSATGDGPNGMPYYEDCDGIEAAANAVGFINRFKEINISYDRSYNGTTSQDLGPCVGGTYNDPHNGDRIIVEVVAQWEPVVSLVPLPAFEIRKQSARTILSSVSIAVTAVPQFWDGTGGAGSSGNLKLSITPSPATYTTVGETITLNFTITNAPDTADISGAFSVAWLINTSPQTNFECGSGTLAPGESTTCSTNYTITQADIDAGKVIFTGAPGVDNVYFSETGSDQQTITAQYQPKITLTKSPSVPATSTVGATITYTYTIKNTGNVTLTNAFSVSDNKIPSGVNCSGATLPLAPGASTNCTANYTVTNADITNGSITNQAVASTTFNAGPVTSNTATATVYTTELVLLVSPSAATATDPNQVITYTYTVSNTSNVTANGLNITDSKATGITCNSTSIPANGSTTCTGTYTVTLANYDAGGSIVATAQANANNGSAISSKSITTTVIISQLPKLTITMVPSPKGPTTPATSLPAGTDITYTYTLTNQGNVTLSTPFTITDDKTTISCLAPPPSFAPGAPPITCSGTYKITAANVDAGAVVNTGSATAKFGATTVQSNTVTDTVITFSGARFKLGLTADPTTVNKPNALIVFTYTITNTGGKPLTSPFSITSSLFGTFNCTGTSPLAPGATTSCQNNKTTSQALTNTITPATAMDGAATVNATAPLPSVTVPAAICNPANLILSPPSESQGVLTWTLTNTTGYILTLNSISATWNTAGDKYLHLVELDPPTTTIFDGSISVDDKDGNALYNGTWAIDPGIHTLVMTFTKNGITVSNMTLTFAEGSCGPLENH